jgi:hypothetical protein
MLARCPNDNIMVEYGMSEEE